MMENLTRARCSFGGLRALANDFHADCGWLLPALDGGSTKRIGGAWCPSRLWAPVGPKDLSLAPLTLHSHNLHHRRAAIVFAVLDTEQPLP